MNLVHMMWGPRGPRGACAARQQLWVQLSSLTAIPLTTEGFDQKQLWVQFSSLTQQGHNSGYSAPASRLGSLRSPATGRPPPGWQVSAQHPQMYFTTTGSVQTFTDRWQDTQHRRFNRSSQLSPSVAKRTRASAALQWNTNTSTPYL